ncbi:MAG TPA: isoprenylcysteine carboxylmethyltransferase family protein [Gemmatimonadaceae bacterium]|nr:isoprenylcysteine carboxylmethyltransferase family protein [Gemmatimonadaceae bacterium]
MLEPNPETIIAALWAAWLVYWWIAARNVKETRWRESLPSQLLHRVPFLLTAILMATPGRLPPVLRQRFLPPSAVLAMLGVALTAAGLGFATWARRHLGRNWSAAVTVKNEHTLITTGPYRWVRHPIYSGLLLALVGSAVAIGEWRAVLAVALALAGIVRKVVLEDSRLRETFPQFDQYRRDTAALVPFVF